MPISTIGSNSLNQTSDLTINGVTVGKGGGSVSTNTAVGASALAVNTSGATNVAVGESALPANTTGSDNTVVGRRAGQFNTTGSQNTMLGVQAMALNTTGGSNTAIGVSALQSNTTASYNTAVGYQAGYANTTGDFVAASGFLALTSNTTGTRNSGFGAYALSANTTGGYNTAVGMQALSGNTTASNNTAVGYQAGYSATTNGYNTFIGQTAGYSTTGGGNTFVGCTNASVGAGYFVTTGTKNTIIGGYHGNQGGLDIRTASNYIVLSDGDGNPRIYVNSAGSMYAPGVYNTTAGVSSNLYVDSSGLFYRATSSLKYKTDVENATHGLADVLKLRPITYRGKAEVDVGKTYGGLLAEEVHDAGLTEFVQYADDGSPDALHYGNMVSLAFKAIQELKALVDAQATEIAELKAKVAP